MRLCLIPLFLVLLLGPVGADEPAWKAKIDKTLSERLVSISCTERPLPAVLTNLSKSTGVSFFLDPASGLEDRELTLAINNLPLETALDLLLAGTKAGARPACGVIVVSKAERLRAFPADAVAAPEALGAADKALWEKVAQQRFTGQFTEVSWQEMLGFLKELSGLSIETRVKVPERTSLCFVVKDLPLLQVLTLLGHSIGARPTLEKGKWAFVPQAKKAAKEK